MELVNPWLCHHDSRENIPQLNVMTPEVQVLNHTNEQSDELEEQRLYSLEHSETYIQSRASDP